MQIIIIAEYNVVFINLQDRLANSDIKSPKGMKVIMFAIRFINSTPKLYLLAFEINSITVLNVLYGELF